MRMVWMLCAGLVVNVGLGADVPVATETIVADVPGPSGEGHDWPIFLGPHGTGVSDETGLLDRWPVAGPRVLWERSVGTGYSAPSVRGNRLVLHHRRGREEIIECLRADDGTPVWRSSYPSNFSDPFGYNNGPRCSPLLTDTRCYTFGAEGKLVCVDLATGRAIWSRDTQADFSVPEGFFGVGCTPVLEGKLLIALVGGQPNSGVVAFDADTGKTIWSAVGQKTWDGAKTGWDSKPVYRWTGEEMVVSYSSPDVVTINGRRYLLVLDRHGLVALDPQTGNERFHYWFRSRTHDSVNAARPIVVGNRIFLSAAYLVGSVLLEVSDDGLGVREVWRDENNMLTHWSTSLHVDGYLYGFSGRYEQEGELRCLDVKDGRVVWATNGLIVDPSTIGQEPTTGKLFDKATRREIPWPLFGRGSKIRYENRWIILGERGTLALSEIDATKYVELSRTSYPQISYPAWTAPVLSRKRLYLRDEDALLCLDLSPEAK